MHFSLNNIDWSVSALMDVRREEVADYMAVTQFATYASIANAVIFALAAIGDVPTETLSLWLVLAISLFLFLLNRSAVHRPSRRSRASQRLIGALCLFSFLAALPWIVMLALFLKSGSPELDLLQLQVCAGMCAGAAFALHRVPAAAIAYFGSVLLALASIALWRDPAGFWATAVYCIPYGAALFVAARATARSARAREDSARLAQETTAQLQSAAQEIRRLASQDGLTCLANRGAFAARLDALCARRSQEGGAFGVLLLDLDRFKSVNEILGHEAGDKVLAAVAERLKSLFDAGVMARLGGDEFAIVLEKNVDVATIMEAAERVVVDLARPLRIDQELIYSGASVGVAVFPDHGRSPKDLLRRAEMALADAKLAGRGQARMFDHGIGDRVAQVEDVERRLRQALERGELELHYQPQYDVATQTIVGAEALLRWRQADGRFISPMTFLPVAAEKGLIKPISDFVFDRAARDIAAWLEQGVAVPGLSLNVHAMDLQAPDDLMDRIWRVEAVVGRLDLLTLEITEGCVVESASDHAGRVLKAIAGTGVALSLDDFGTGHASLIHLRDLPVGEMKIDKSFVDGMLSSRDDKAIIAAALEVARSMELRCVVEGVETEEQRQMLLALSGDERFLVGQGWLWSRAVPAEDFVALLRQETDKVAVA